MKIILSRKSMDAQCGGLPSPVLAMPDGTWKMFPLPIPYLHSDLHYRDILLFENVTAWDFIKAVSPSYKQQQTCHLDPDLYRNYLRHRPQGWRPAFGQVAQAQTHLANNGIGHGDLFLFFGWFQFAEWRNGTFRYKKTPDYPMGFHALYGYLQIDEIYKPTLEAVPDWLQWHPHAAQQQHGVFKKLNNTIYTATEVLRVGVNATNSPGAGWFRFNERLILTKRGSANRTRWSLPAALHPANGIALSYHAGERWQRGEGESLLRAASQGQEFIFIQDRNGAAEAWVIDIMQGSTAAM